MKNIIFLFILISGIFFSQNISFRKNDKIYELDKKIRKGDFTSFLEIGNYLESNNPLTEYLGYHIINTNEANVAKRIISENSFFLQNEFKIDSTISIKSYREFLMKNQNKIIFSDLADAFVITPFEDRKTDFEIQELTQAKLDFLESKRNEIFNSNWVKTNHIDDFIKQKDPKVLLVLSSLFLKNRYRFNEHKNNNAEIINLIRLLTKSNIAVPDESGQMNSHIEEDFYEISKLNLAIFFANHYKNYKWSESKNSFENSQLKQIKNDVENNLFDMLSNEDDSIALNAFIKLTRSNPEKVIALSGQFEKADIDFNYTLPTFPYRFLNQLVYLTDYCQNKNIDFTGNTDLKNSINLLKTDLAFSERRKLENSLINSLTLDEITAFEYWSLIYEKDWHLTYSAGRIIDKFYSKNWNKMISNKKYLESYLLKSKLFENLGIIGLCNKYLTKFKGSSIDIIKSLESLQTENDKVKLQIVKAIQVAKIQIVYKEPEKKDWYGNIDREIKDFKTDFKKVIAKAGDKEKFEDEMSYLLSQIKYSQIGDALTTIKTIEINPSHLYSFMNRDFGLSFIGNFEKAEIRQNFLNNYLKLNEYNLYKYYLVKSKVDFLNSKEDLDFDKIYEILKYDINIAFAGGGGGENDNGVYAIIKLLELKFKTSLGYPKKYCCSDNIYACSARERANSWMNYLKVNKYIKDKHNEPITFAYEK